MGDASAAQGAIVPIASQIDSERDKWCPLARPPLFAAVSPYSDGLAARGAVPSSVIGGAMLPHAPQLFAMPETEDRATVARVDDDA
jgi:hypothetical protein